MNFLIFKDFYRIFLMFFYLTIKSILFSRVDVAVDATKSLVCLYITTYARATWRMRVCVRVCVLVVKASLLNDLI